MEPVAGATPKVVKSEQEWQEQLNPYEYAVLREAATEPAWSGEYVETKTAGIYECRACGTELFRSETKFESHCGWPSFYDARDADSVILREDRSHGMVRVEVLCANCQSHLGHLFEGEGYATPTDQRYCINSVALRHIPES
ncbi:peptide-methionine (R)-S-oxide reductase MsrB [Saccharopolyspora gloriosae]|uniref:peptide-methionine (R)-S-oxide reductase n=1 Tax=Saccharopolyspora gloriosae TaxID=455344 RepID=A0A840ND77_9PSEU|nr:peptide-methionine (R)-S-oxide reductase MsrB [Saccharopolyspora gloriosae]MBB5068273.1 peptide-methionine (R)-S-oxide reductase [Saccharopolyspora gloriosae]